MVKSLSPRDSEIQVDSSWKWQTVSGKNSMFSSLYLTKWRGSIVKQSFLILGLLSFKALTKKGEQFSNSHKHNSSSELKSLIILHASISVNYLTQNIRSNLRCSILAMCYLAFWSATQGDELLLIVSSMILVGSI